MTQSWSRQSGVLSSHPPAGNAYRLSLSQDISNMSTKNSINFAVYNLVSHFPRQPRDMRCCPCCGGNLSISDISPSKAVANDLLHLSLIPVHLFSRLYRCNMCYWWGVRESWAFCECSSTPDYLIASVADGRQDFLLNLDQLKLLIREILDNEHIYDKALPLPDALGQLFIRSGNEELILEP
jgi:hypothetical protein